MEKGGRILHILFDGPDDLADRMIEGHEALEDVALKIVDISEGNMDSHALVDEIFSADKVFSWHR